MENTNLQRKEIPGNNLIKFLIPSFIGLLLFVIPLPYGNIIPLEGLSTFL